MEKVEISKTRLSLSTWDIARVLVIFFFVVSISGCSLIPASLSKHGHPVLANLAIWDGVLYFFIGLVVLLPRTGNASALKWMQILGRLPTIARFLGMLLVWVASGLSIRLLASL